VRRNTQPMQMDPYVLATVNPFHTDAAGARIPDDSMFPSVPYNATTRINLTTNANGALAFAVTPAFKQSVFVAAPANVSASGVTNWAGGSATTITNYSAVNTSFDLARQVAWGVRIVATSALTNTAGTIYAAYVPNYYKNSILPVDWPTTPDQIVSLPWSDIYPVMELNTEPVIYPAKRIDPGSLRYRSIEYPASSPNQIETSDGWGSFVFIISGSNAATTSITVEVVYRTEMMPQPTATLISTGTSYPSNTPLMDTVSNLSSVMPLSYIDNDDPGFMTHLINEATTRMKTMWARSSPYIAQSLVAGAAHVGGQLATNFVRYASRGNARRIGY